MKTRKEKKLRRRRTRTDGTSFPWGMHYSSWCVNCRREIREYDLVRLDTYYDADGKVQSFVHHDCRDVNDRPRIPRPEMTEHTTSEGIRKLTIMATKSKARKSRKQKAAEDAEEEMQSQTAANAEVDDEEDEEEIEEAPKPKRSKSKKGKASAKGKKAKSSGDSKPKRTETAGATFAQTTGELVSELIGDAPKKVRVVAANLAKGKEVTNADLILLRDGIKDLAAKDRENGGKLSPKLSAVNTRVRRLERASR